MRQKTQRGAWTLERPLPVGIMWWVEKARTTTLMAMLHSLPVLKQARPSAHPASLPFPRLVCQQLNNDISLDISIKDPHSGILRSFWAGLCLEEDALVSLFHTSADCQRPLLRSCGAVDTFGTDYHSVHLERICLSCCDMIRRTGVTLLVAFRWGPRRTRWLRDR